LPSRWSTQARRTARVGLRGAVLAAAVTFLLLAAAVPAMALTHAAATRIALRILQPRHEAGPVVVFSVPAPVGRGGRVYEAGPPPMPRVKPLARAVYVYWEDLSHGAFFAHSSRLLLIDARTGRPVRSARMKWFLIINNRLAPFLITARGYEGNSYVVYSSISRAVGRRAHAARYAAGGHPPPRTNLLAHDCMIPIGDFTSPLFKGGGKAMLTFASRIGLKTIEPDVPTAKSLAKAVDKATAAGCNDVFIYLAGHGRTPDQAAFPPGVAKEWFNMAKAVQVDSAHPGEPAGVMTNPAFVNRGGKVVDESSYVTPGDLIAIARAHESADFKIKIDSCFADRFAPVFDETDNVRVLETSSSFNEVSAGGYVKGDEYATVNPKTHAVTGGMLVDNIDNPDGAGGFTNGNMHGLYDWAAFSSPTEDLVQGLAEAFGLGMPFDESVKFGYTTPHLRVRPARTATMGFLPLIIGNGLWTYLTADEVAFHFSFQLQSYVQAPHAFRAALPAPLDAVKVVVAPAASGPRQIVNSLCPPQLPTASVSRTTNPNDTLTCSGGSLAIGEAATLDVQVTPAPIAGMGGQLFGDQSGAVLGPFAITGP